MSNCELCNSLCGILTFNMQYSNDVVLRGVILMGKKSVFSPAWGQSRKLQFQTRASKVICESVLITGSLSCSNQGKHILSSVYLH